MSLVRFHFVKKFTTLLPLKLDSCLIYPLNQSFITHLLYMSKPRQNFQSVLSQRISALLLHSSMFLTFSPIKFRLELYSSLKPRNLAQYVAVASPPSFIQLPNHTEANSFCITHLLFCTNFFQSLTNSQFHILFRTFASLKQFSK